jgi:hyperosmotically inducible periplasmic protein
MKNKPKIAIASLTLAFVPAVLLADADTDRRIEQTAESSYTFHAVLEDKVTVEAKDGVATLKGSVPDADQKTLAEDTVREVPGVVGVDDDITVQSDQWQQSDNWINLKIHTTLLMRANVSTRNTRVDVKDGVVTLTGTADSLAQKELTEAYVKDIEGVKSVTNDLVVQPDPNSESSGEEIDDASITAQVKYELLANRATSALHTKVTTIKGVVEVSGPAANDAERDLVTKLTQSVRGVKSVTNRMTLASQ